MIYIESDAAPSFRTSWMSGQCSEIAFRWAVLPDMVGLPDSKKNLDHSHPLYGTKNGIYQSGCGISKPDDVVGKG